MNMICVFLQHSSNAAPFPTELHSHEWDVTSTNIVMHKKFWVTVTFAELFVFADSFRTLSNKCVNLVLRQHLRSGVDWQKTAKSNPGISH